MKLADLLPEARAKIKTVRWDRIIEKHEGPEKWDAVFRYADPEFLMIEGHPVLLPIDQSHHANITILRTIFSADGQSLTLLLTSVRDKLKRLFSRAHSARENKRFGRSCDARPPKTLLTRTHVIFTRHYLRERLV